VSLPLGELAIVLCGPRFPENVGAAARACANMGCPNLVVVTPGNWNEERALALATPKGAPLLRQARFEDDLASALAGFTAVYGTTARGGGWRRDISTPAKAAPEMWEAMAQGGRVAVVFGAEDRGLTNEEINLCPRLLTIPTVDDASSLNLAQAVLVVLYECFKSAPGRAFRPAGPKDSRPATLQEHELLYDAVKRALRALDFFKDANEDYWLLPLRRFFGRVSLRRNEFNQLMGVCRQILWLAGARGRGEQRPAKTERKTTQPPQD